MIGVDVGGTFTDVVAIHDGKIVVHKVATQAEAFRSVVEGAKGVDPSRSQVFNHASTHGLNAILTRNLPKVALLGTIGHRDVLDRGRVMRPAAAVNDPSWRRAFSDATAPLVPRYLRRGVVERVTSNGAIALPLDERQLVEQLEILQRCDVEGVAICFINAYVDGAHEMRAREIVADVLGDVPCSISSEVSPLAKEYARASTTVIDVLMKLRYGSYDQSLRTGLSEIGFAGDLNYADSAAMLVAADVAMQRPYRVVFSGPAAGTAACAHFGAYVDRPNLLCVDIGGTSTDISVVTAGRPYRNTTFEFEPDMIVNSLSTAVNTIGAGGGSIVMVNEIGELRVGPDSAGGVPGPACYGAGGTRPTMTDACLLMGFLDPAEFLGGRVKIYPELAAEAFDSLEIEGDLGRRVRDAWRIGLNNIVEGIYNIALRHGVDPSDYSVVAYGAAGPMMLPSVLDYIKAASVIVPPHPGLFSALGLLSSDLVYSDSRSAYTMLGPDAAPVIDEILAGLESAVLDQVKPADRHRVTVSRSFDARLYGQSWDTPFVDIPAGPVTSATVAEMVARFHAEYELRNGSRFDTIPVEAVTFRVQLTVPSERLRFEPLAARAETDGVLAPIGVTTLHHVYGDPTSAAVYAREALRAGDVVAGPAIIREPLSTTVLPLGRSLVVGGVGELIIT